MNRTGDVQLGETLRIPIPPISGESRKKIIKIVKIELEKSKISIRNVRRDINNNIKKKLLQKEISSDYSEKIEKSIQSLTNKMIKCLVKIYEDKEQELTKRIKQKLDEVNYRIFDIHSIYRENKLLRDLTKKNVILTSFTETTLENTVSVV